MTPSPHRGPWGLGLRPQHFELWRREEHLPVLEVLGDNFLHAKGGPALWNLDSVAEKGSPLTLHTVGMNIAGLDEDPPLEYLMALKRLAKRLSAKVISDHLCFTGLKDAPTYELLPIPHNAYFLDVLIPRVRRVQETLEQRLSLENVSSYFTPNGSEWSEMEFFAHLTAETGCGLMLDVNNVYVAARNAGKDPLTELRKVPWASVTQIHVAGHSEKEGYLFDTHDAPVRKEVWELLRVALRHVPPNTPVILERDDRDAPLSPLREELAYGQSVCLEP